MNEQNQNCYHQGKSVSSDSLDPIIDNGLVILDIYPEGRLNAARRYAFQVRIYIGNALDLLQATTDGFKSPAPLFPLERELTSTAQNNGPSYASAT